MLARSLSKRPAAPEADRRTGKRSHSRGHPGKRVAEASTLAPRAKAAGPSAYLDPTGHHGGRPIRVVLADAHPVVRVGLRHILERSQDIEIVGEASDGATACRQAETLRPDVIVMDVSMPELNGIDAARAILRRGRGTRVLILSVHCTEATALAAVEVGVGGYVLKDASVEEIDAALRTVAAGMSYFSQAVAQLLARHVGASGRGASRLSSRERQIVQLLSEGRRLGEIAAQLSISTQTVKSHRAHAMRKLAVRTTAELVRFAIRSGLTS